MKQFRGFHGEVTYTLIKENVEGEISKHKTFIVGHSESGHHHVLESDVEFDKIMADNGMYIRLYDAAKIVHQKTYDIHETTILEPGLYRFDIQKEYNPFTKQIEKMRD